MRYGEVEVEVVGQTDRHTGGRTVFPRAERLLLIAMVSLSRSPVAPESETRSEPARSARFSTAVTLRASSPAASFHV